MSDMPNHLAHEKSPYLLQHAGNPVDWRPWSPAAFEIARAEDKPVFLSVGYSTCHWCHVMAHESFEDAEVAERVNRAFVPVKVDREERPDVDAAYMAACVAMNGSGGWPLTVLLTPDQKPFWAGTYLPKPQLLSLLSQAERLWREDRTALLTTGEELTTHLRREETARPGAPSRELVSAGTDLFRRSFDAKWGGFGGAPKFPSAHNLLFLLRCGRLTGEEQAEEMAQATLEHMYRGGLFDHVGGGFARYSTDERWLVPHFEKMLYDNALLAMAYTEGYQGTRRRYARKAACQTLDYVLDALTGPEGGFYCGQDADSDGVEGKYYVFTPAELLDVLGPTGAESFCRRFDITSAGNWEGKSIPNLIGTPDWEREPEEVETLRRKVRSYRQGRTALHLDDKVLTAWNGLMIAAMSRAGLVLGEARYGRAAETAAAFLRTHLTEDSGRLLARWRDGEAAHPGTLDDYAFYAWGLLELYEATFQPRYLAESVRLAGLLLELFFDETQGGFYPYASDGEQLITRTKEVYDGALPSGNAVAALVLSRLARLTGEGHWRKAADLQLQYLAGAVREYPAGCSFTLLTLLEELWPTAELVCTAQAVPEELRALLGERSRPGLTVLVKTPEWGADLTELAPFTAGYPVPETGARYYLCRGGACSQPVESVAALGESLDKSEQKWNQE